jgi:membrane protease subunit (stomatin/prohibitin family)
MNEFTQEPVVFLNETDSSYDVSAGIIFRKSGVYDVTITGNKTIVSKVSERKTGKWITQEFGSWAECSECHELYDIPIANSNFCPNCGADMRMR